MRRLQLSETAARWRPSLPVVGKGLGPVAAAPALLFLFSYFTFVAFFSTLKNIDKVKMAAGVFHSTNFPAVEPSNGTMTVSQKEPQNIGRPSLESPIIFSQPRPEFPIALQKHQPNINSSGHELSIISQKKQQNMEQPRPRLEFPIACNSTGGNETDRTCPASYYPAQVFESEHDHQLPSKSPESGTCPDYFRWIHEDLRPWRESGITRDMVERARPTAHFRLVIIKGRAYVEQYKKSIQTRDLFTIWGILQLLRRYPGQVPDLELMFDCDDQPVIRSRDYRGPNSTGLPPLFRYCGDKWTHDIVFPDWSFWGWAEINIRPWENLVKELKEGNGRTKWSEREPYAYWKGNPFVAETRRDLLKCNVSESHDWNARLFIQDWIGESQQGYKHSNLPSQCTHRYKIYIEGYAWSVSEKYILACDSMTLLVKPHFYDFFTRSLEPLRQYWPIREDDKCRSIEFAVHWGNTHKHEAAAMGRAAASFIQDQVKMEYVYDYMFHLLTEYSKLMRFEPAVPQGAVEVCSEALGCAAADGPQRDFMMESMVKGPAVDGPCNLPPPFEPKAYDSLWRSSISAMRRVQRWENGYWEGLHKKNQ